MAVAEAVFGAPPQKGVAAEWLPSIYRPDLLPGGAEPEQRVAVGGISWKKYLEIDRARGVDRAGPRFFYYGGELEIMTTSGEHERIKTLICDFVGFYIEHAGLEQARPRGQATMRNHLAAAGAEPDGSWCLAEGAEFPDLVLEVALSSGGVEKLELYRAMGIREVWIWRNQALEIHGLGGTGEGYTLLSESRALPGFDRDLLAKCVVLPSWVKARGAFRAGLRG